MSSATPPARRHTPDAPTAAPRLFHALARGAARLWRVGEPGPPAGPRPVADGAALAKLAAGPLWWVEHPADVFFGELAQEHWDPADFADLRPPAAAMQFEFPRPRVVKSVVHGLQPQPAAERGHFGLTLDRFAMRDPMVTPYLTAGLDPEGSVLAANAYEEPPSGGPPSGMTAMGLIPLDRRGRPVAAPSGNQMDVVIAQPAPGRGRVGEAEIREAGARLASALWPACFALDAVNGGRARLEPMPLPRAVHRTLERETGRAWATPQRVILEALPPRAG